MDVNELADLIEEHTTWCVEKYQPQDLPHLTLDQVGAFQDKMIQSLTHFAIWLRTVKAKVVESE